jgi:hypothetical protein
MRLPPRESHLGASRNFRSQLYLLPKTLCLPPSGVKPGRVAVVRRTDGTNPQGVHLRKASVCGVRA